MRRTQFLLILAGCSSSPAPAPAAPAVAAPPPDATVSDAALPDAPPGPDAELAAAPASVFRFHATGSAPPKDGPRLETWTLRALADRGVVDVQRMRPGDNGTWIPGTRSLYLGTATDDGKTLTLALAAGTDKLSLTCTRDKLDVAAATAVRKPGKKKQACGDTGVWSPTKTTSLAVLSCKDARYDAPMIFAPAPGIEYLFVDDGCAMQGGGYRQIAPDGAIAPVR